MFVTTSTMQKSLAVQMQMINLLREGTGAWVMVMSDSSDLAELEGTEDTAVDAYGSWTEWEEVRFTGYSVMDCLRKASAAKRKYEEDTL